MILYLSKGLFYNTTFEELLIKKKKKKKKSFFTTVKIKTGDADNLSYSSNRAGGCDRSSMGLLAQAKPQQLH